MSAILFVIIIDIGGMCFIDTGDSEKYMYQFVVEKDGDRIIFGCQEEREQQSWVMALCRATGQKHRPEPVLKRSSDNGDCCIHTQSVSQRIGLDAFLQTDVSTFDHNALFEKLQVMTLDYRLSEGTGNLVSRVPVIPHAVYIVAWFIGLVLTRSKVCPG